MVRTGIIIVLTLLNLMCFSSLCLANDFLVVGATVDKNTITIGDPIEYVLSIKRDEKVKTEQPVFGDKLGDFQIKDIKIGKEKRYGLRFRNHGWYFMSQIRLTLTIFDVGSFTIPPIKIKGIIEEEGKQEEASTKEITIIVKSILPVDAEDIRGFKGPVEVPSPFSKTSFRVGLFGAVFIATLATGLIIYYHRRKREKEKKVAIVEEVIPKPPHRVAFEELDRIDRSYLLRNGCVEEFYVLISEVIRRYIKSRYNIDTVQKNTEEIIEEIRSIPLGDNIPETIEDFLKECDLVKFARLYPQRNESQKALEKAQKIVRITSSPNPPREGEE